VLCGLHTDLWCPLYFSTVLRSLHSSSSYCHATSFKGVLLIVVSALICYVLRILTLFVRSSHRFAVSSSCYGAIYFNGFWWTVVAALICNVLCIITLFMRSPHRFAVSSSCSGAVYFNSVFCSVVSYRFVMSSVFQHCLCGLCTLLVHTVVLHILTACCGLLSPHWFVAFSVF